MQLSSGTRLGSYDITAKLGEGGMGEVYRAKDTKLGRDVAIKVLPESFALDADRVARFTREAQVLASLNHPNIAAIYGIEEQGATRALVMELVEGEDLSAVIARGPEGPHQHDGRSRGPSGPRMDIADTLAIARQIADALEAAHEQGIVHRDLKPQNIKVKADGTVKVLDFGLAKAADPSSSSSANLANSPTMTSPAMTGRGMILGTAAYMAPEQAKGRAVDKRADIWAFGVVLYEMLTGRRAFKGDDVSDLLVSVLRDTPDLSALPAQTPAGVRRVIARCLEKDPKTRLRDIGEARVLLSGDPQESAQESRATSRGGPGLMAAGLVAAAALAAGAALGVFTHDAIVPGAARVTEVTYAPVTFDTGFVFAARFAKDPTTVVYSADWDGQTRDVFVTSLDTHEARPLGFAGADLLGLAPSGDMVIQTHSRFEVGNPYTRIGTLERSTMMGGAPRAEDSEIRFADIASDGAIALVRRTNTEWLLEFPSGHVVGRQEISNNRIGAGGFLTPRISPDGKYVAAMKGGGVTGFDVQIFARGGALVTEDRIGLADWWGVGWRSNSEVWFAGAETSGTQTRIWAFGLNGKRRLVFRAPGSITLHDVNGHGDALASFDRSSTRIELTAASGAVRDMSWQDTASLSDVSNDGVVLGELRGDSGGPNGTVVVWPIGATQPVRIAEGRGIAISMDGATALAMGTSTTNPLQLVPVGPGRPKALEIGRVDRLSWGGWLPDGRVILDVVQGGGPLKTLVVSPSGGAPQPFLPPSYRLDGSRLVAPDGHAIVARAETGALSLCALPAATCVPLPGTQATDTVAGWTADSRAVLVFSNNTNTFDLQALDPATGRRTPWKTVRTKEPTIGSARRLVVAPNGDIVLGYDRSRTDLYVIKGLR